jgi:hypothetical protein
MAELGNFPEIVIHNHSELVDAFARIKNEILQISNETLECIGGFAKGHVDNC